MYFSKSSGYVLRRAKCLSPTSYFFACLKGNHRTLGVKSPIDDPSKPPLRLNVPNDSSQKSEERYQDSSEFSKKDFHEPRSKSLLSKRNTHTFNAEVDTNVLQKSESETHLSKFHDDIIHNVHSLDYASPPYSEANEQKRENKDGIQVNFQRNSQLNSQFDFQKSDYNPNEGLVTLFDENYYYESNINKTLETGKHLANNNNSINEINEETDPNKSNIQKQNGEDESHNSLYIIIDVPEKQEEGKFENVNIAFQNSDAVGGKKFNSQQLSVNNFSTVKALPDSINSMSKISKGNDELNTEKPVNLAREKNTNLPKEKESEKKDKSNVKFEVHEIDDASTYVFHLKLKRRLTEKPSTVERVPEKEINTRTQTYGSENYDPVRIKSGKGVTKEVLDINVDDFTNIPKHTEKILKSQVQGKRDLNETLSKTKSTKNSNKTFHKVKSKRCLTDCPYQMKMPSRKDNEKPDVNKNYKNQIKHESSNNPFWISEEMRNEENSYKGYVNKTKNEAQSFEKVKIPFEKKASEISPFQNPESLAYQFLQDWEASYNFKTDSKTTNQQPIKETFFQTTDLSHLPEHHETSSNVSKPSENYSKKSKNFQSSKSYSGIKEVNQETFKREDMSADFAKNSPKVEGNKSSDLSSYEFGKNEEKKEYFIYPLIKRPKDTYGKKSVVSSPEKRPQEKTEYYRLPPSSSQSHTKNSALQKEAITAATEGNIKKKNRNYKLSNVSPHTGKTIGVFDKEQIKLTYLQNGNQNPSKKKLKKRDSENKFDKNEKKTQNFQFSGVQSNEKWNIKENEQINHSNRNKKIDNNSHVPIDRNRWSDRDENAGCGGYSKPTKVKLSSAEENLSTGLKREPNVNFQTSESVIKISSDRPSMKFCAAFPPTLSEVISNRCKGLGLVKQECLFQQTWSKKINFRLKEFEGNRQSMKNVDNLSENSILFPKMETQSFELNYPLFKYKKDKILNVLKNEKESDEKIADNMANIANENLTESKGKSSVDSLMLMKKVKEIVDLDLQNAVRIFEGREAEPFKDTSSVLTWTGDTWKVNIFELEKLIENRKRKTTNEMKSSNCSDENLIKKYKNVKAFNIISNYDENSQKIGDYQIPQFKHLPGTKERETEIKLNSVVEHYPNNNVFKINKDELKYALRKSSEKFEKLYAQAVVLKIKRMVQNENDGEKVNMGNTLNQAKENSAILEMKNGDSILVFDELTQTWTVDYSILEKRREEKQQEEELARKSELILETFEKIEKENMSTNKPMPDSRSPKIFDYNKAEWKVYEPEKTNPPNKVKKIKQPFRESNAEEIRKKNSDLYENLFAVKKEETKMNQNRKEAPGLKSSSSTKKESLHRVELLAKDMKENDSKDSSECNRDCNDSRKDNEKIKKDQDCDNEDENYWETFLKKNILPFDRPAASVKEPSAKEDSYKQKKDKQENVMNKKVGSMEKPLSSPLSSSEKKEHETKFRLPNIFKKNDLNKSNSSNKNQSTTASKISEHEKVLKDPPISDANIKNLSKNHGSEAPKKGSDTESLKSSSPTNETPLKSTSSQIIAPSQALDPLKTETSPLCGKSTKNWSEHYVSDNIVEMSKPVTNEKISKPKSNKVETVKLNIISDKKVPSIISEINLNKKCDEQVKESSVVPTKPGSEELKKPSDNIKKKIDKPSLENKRFYKNFEKYKTPFSDPEYEEKSVKINSDLESNPNLKKLETWNKTLVLQDVAKPNENIETWLKDESDKMATLLLKVLQEAAEGKPKKKNSQTKTMPSDKNLSDSNPYDNIRKKQEKNSENFLFKMRSVNLAIENEKKVKNIEDKKSIPLKFLPGTKNIPVQSAKTSKPSKIVEAIKISNSNDSHHLSTNFPIQETPIEEGTKAKASELTQDKMDNFYSKELYQTKLLPDWTEKIPGPEILKKISNTWKLFPIIGCQLTIFTLLRIFQLVNLGNSFLSSVGRDKSRRLIFSKLFAKYGPIVNLQGPLSGSVILIYKPEHLSGIFQQDALISVRSVFDSLDLCRHDADMRLLQTGISTDWSKPEWNNLKKKTNDPLIKGCEKFLALVEMAGDCLVNKIKLNKNGQNFVSEDFMIEIKKWSMEGYFSVIFEKSFGFLESTNEKMAWLVEPEKLYFIVEEATNYLNKCERGFQIWRVMPTPSSVGLSQAYRSLSGILTKQLYQTEINLKSKNDLLKKNNLSFCRDLTFMESMLLNDGMPMEETICNLIDIMIIGTNAMNSALGFMLYNLAQNVKIQNKLLKEVKEHLPEKSSRLDYHKLHSLKYLQACLKESLRLNMPFPLFFRLLQNDVILSNYIIPKGTYVVMDSKISCMKEQIFDNPEKFLPERWLNDERWMQANHPFSSFPFCYGPRAELAKRVAEIQLWSCLAKIVRNFEIEYQFGEIHGNENIISFPDKPLKLNFIERLD